MWHVVIRFGWLPPNHRQSRRGEGKISWKGLELLNGHWVKKGHRFSMINVKNSCFTTDWWWLITHTHIMFGHHCYIVVMFAYPLNSGSDKTVVVSLRTLSKFDTWWMVFKSKMKRRRYIFLRFSLFKHGNWWVFSFVELLFEIFKHQCLLMIFFICRLCLGQIR